MSGECDKCSEHALECECPIILERKWISKEEAMEILPKSFDQLVAEKAGCFEFAWNGFVRIYEDGEKRCECNDCKTVEKIEDELNLLHQRPVM